MADRYKKWREKAEKHDLNHTTVKRNGQKDFSCTICHQPSEIMRKEFRRFWKWYKKEIPEVRSYSGKTEENFEELMKEDFRVKERTGTEGYSMDNRSSSEKTEKEMSEESGKPETYDKKGNSSYKKRDRGYNDNNRREITCYRCEKKGHYLSNCEEEEEMKYYNCGKNG